MTRHKSLASAMSALLAYKNRPEGDPVPVQTNWSLTPANDNADPSELEDFRVERNIRITPSVSAIMEQVRTGDVERNKAGQIIRIGKLRFSDGTQVERGYKLGADGAVVATEIRMPAGAMLGVRDAQDRMAGGDVNPVEVTASNNYFADMFGVAKRQRRPSGKRKNGEGFSLEERKRTLAEAYANTPELPPVTKCPPGLPSAGSRVADSFLGMKKAAKGDGGSISWQDISTARVDREVWAQAIAELSEQDRRTLDAVADGRAKTLSEVGVGGHKRTAERRGKRLLSAANDNLKEILKKVTA